MVKNIFKKTRCLLLLLLAVSGTSNANKSFINTNQKLASKEQFLTKEKLENLQEVLANQGNKETSGITSQEFFKNLNCNDFKEVVSNNKDERVFFASRSQNGLEGEVRIAFNNLKDGEYRHVDIKDYIENPSSENSCVFKQEISINDPRCYQSKKTEPKGPDGIVFDNQKNSETGNGFLWTPSSTSVSTGTSPNEGDLPAKNPSPGKKFTPFTTTPDLRSCKGGSIPLVSSLDHKQSIDYSKNLNKNQPKCFADENTEVFGSYMLPEEIERAMKQQIKQHPENIYTKINDYKWHKEKNPYYISPEDKITLMKNYVECCKKDAEERSKRLGELQKQKDSSVPEPTPVVPPTVVDPNIPAPGKDPEPKPVVPPTVEDPKPTIKPPFSPTPLQTYQANKVFNEVGNFLNKVPEINQRWSQLGDQTMVTGLDFIMWVNQKPAEQPQQGDDKQGFSKLYDMPEVEAKLLKYQQKENERKEQLLKEQQQKEQLIKEQQQKEQQQKEQQQKFQNKYASVFNLFQRAQTQPKTEMPVVKPEKQQEKKRKRDDDNDTKPESSEIKKKCTEKAKESDQGSSSSKPTAFEILSEAANDTAKFAQALGKGLTEGVSEAVTSQLAFLKDLATKPLETLEKEYVTPIKEMLKDIILSGELNEGFYPLTNSEIRQEALDHFGQDFVGNVQKFKTTWSMANNLQRAEITGRIVGGIVANKKLNDFGKGIFSGGGKSGFSQEKIVGDGVKNVGAFGNKIASNSKQCAEIILSKFSTFEQARNKALEIVGDIGSCSKAYYGRLENSKGFGKIIGRVSSDKKVRWYLDYDPIKGTHINVHDFRQGKGSAAKKYAIPFEGTEENFESLLKHLNR